MGTSPGDGEDGNRRGGKPEVGRGGMQELEEVVMARDCITIKDYLF